MQEKISFSEFGPLWLKQRYAVTALAHSLCILAHASFALLPSFVCRCRNLGSRKSASGASERGGEKKREGEGAAWTSMIYCWKLVVVVVMAPATVGGPVAEKHWIYFALPIEV